MKTLTAILNFFKKVFSKQYLPLTLGIIIFLLLIFNFQTCNSLKNQKLENERIERMNEQNLKALTDSINVYFDKKLGLVVSEKMSFVVDNLEDLKKYNKELYDEVIKLKGTVAAIHSDVKIIIPELSSQINHIAQDSDSTFTIPWAFNFNDEGLNQSLIGNSRFGLSNNKPFIIGSKLTTNEMDIKLRYNIVETDKTYKVVAYSPSTLVKFTELESVLLEKNFNVIPSTTTKRFFFGPYAGFGMNYNPFALENKYSAGFQIGFGIGYNLNDRIKK